MLSSMALSQFAEFLTDRELCQMALARVKTLEQLERLIRRMMPNLIPGLPTFDPGYADDAFQRWLQIQDFPENRGKKLEATAEFWNAFHDPEITWMDWDDGCSSDSEPMDTGESDAEEQFGAGEGELPEEEEMFPLEHFYDVSEPRMEDHKRWRLRVDKYDLAFKNLEDSQDVVDVGERVFQTVIDEEFADCSPTDRVAIQFDMPCSHGLHLVIESRQR